MPNTSQELVLRISGDSRGGQQAIQQIADALGGLHEKLGDSSSTATDVGNRLKDAFEHPIDAVKNLAGSVSGELLDSLGGAGVVAGATAGILAGLGVVTYEVSERLFELTQRAADAGERLVDIHDKTGMTVEGTSRLSYAMEVAGGSIDQVSNAMFMFERRMSDSPDVVEKGLQKIGLSLNAIFGLKPDEQFTTIAEAVAGTEDPVDRAGALFDIFGRQGRDLAPVLDKLNDAFALTKGLAPFSEEEARAAEHYAMELRAVRVEYEQLGISLGREFLPVAQFLLNWFKDVRAQLGTETFLAFGGLYLQYREATLYGSVLANGVGELPKAPGTPSLFSAGTLPSITEGLDHEKSIITELTGKLEILNRERREAARAIKAQWRATEKNIEFSRTERNEAEKTIDRQAGGQTVLRDLMMAQGAAGGAPPIAARLLATLGGPAVRNAFGETLSGLIGAMPDLSAQAQKRMADLLAGGPTLKEQLGANFGDVFQQVPQLVISSLTGGGGVKGAAQGAGSLLGSTLGGTLGKSISMFGKFGGPIGAAIGSLAGPLIGALFNIGKPSQQELEGRDVEGQFQKQFGSFNDMLGAVAKAYEATGRSAQQARADVNALMAAEKLGGDAAKAAVDKINQAFNDQKQDAADLEAAIKKYGFSIAELGPTLQKQKLDDQAHTLENDFRVLVGAGVDYKTVLDKMGGSLSQYVQLAKKTGMEVPAEMKPLLEQAAKLGDLTDENGQKITDLQGYGVTFAETFSKGIDRLLKGFNDILTKIGLIPAAAQDAANRMPKDWHLPNAPQGGDGREGAATGGLVTSSGILHFMRGGLVPRYRGTDTVPAMLTPGEIILNRAQQAALASHMAGQTITINAPNSFFRDRRSMQELARYVADALADSVRQQVPVSLRA